MVTENPDSSHENEVDTSLLEAIYRTEIRDSIANTLNTKPGMSNLDAINAEILNIEGRAANNEARVSQMAILEEIRAEEVAKIPDDDMSPTDSLEQLGHRLDDRRVGFEERHRRAEEVAASPDKGLASAQFGVRDQDPQTNSGSIQSSSLLAAAEEGWGDEDGSNVVNMDEYSSAEEVARRAGGGVESVKFREGTGAKVETDGTVLDARDWADEINAELEGEGHNFKDTALSTQGSAEHAIIKDAPARSTIESILPIKRLGPGEANFIKNSIEEARNFGELSRILTEHKINGETIFAVIYKLSGKSKEVEATLFKIIEIGNVNPEQEIAS